MFIYNSKLHEIWPSPPSAHQRKAFDQGPLLYAYCEPCLLTHYCLIRNLSEPYSYHPNITVSIHCAPEMSEIDCIGRIESFWPKFVRGW